MTPYWQSQDGRIALYCADCRDFLPSLPTASVDVILADPPYGDTSLAWDAFAPEWLDLCAPPLAPTGSLWCFGSLRMFLEHAAAFAGWNLAQDLIWEKHNGSSFHADRFRRVHEHLVQFYPRGRRWEDVYKRPVTTLDATARTVRRKQRPPHTGHIEAGWYASRDGGPRLMRSVIFVPSCHGEAIHPTQKPVGILTPVLRYSCPPGGTVLDPFAGSGSTGAAARLEGRRAILCERSEADCEQAARRLSQAVLPLEEGAAS